MEAAYRKWLEEIFHTYYHKVYGFVYARVENAAAAEDLASAIFLKIAENIHRYDKNRGALSTWIFTIAINEVRSYYRAQKRPEPIPLDDIAELTKDDDTEQAVLENDRRARLLAFMRHLPSRNQDILLLKYFGEMSNREIAEALALSPTNIGTILSRTIKKLREACDEGQMPAYKLIGENPSA